MSKAYYHTEKGEPKQVLKLYDSVDGKSKQVRMAYVGDQNGKARAFYAPPPKIYGVSINLSNSDPFAAVTYTGDAVGMTPGSEWDNTPIFQNIRPCLLKDGMVVGYLNPDDYTRFVDGTPADITSGDAGDVMIEIPKMGLSIDRGGNTMTVKLTADKKNKDFHYYAHTRAAEGDREKLYVGAYHGYSLNKKIRSLSGKAPTVSQTMDQARTQVQANGPGYDMLSFYPLTLLQCLYLIRYKNLDSQTALGCGYTGGSYPQVTGATDKNGLYYGVPGISAAAGYLSRLKCLGIEDLWGNILSRIDGFYSNANREVYTAYKEFNSSGTGYKAVPIYTRLSANMTGFMSKPIGTGETGFLPEEANGSAAAYFADKVDRYADTALTFGGAYDDSIYGLGVSGIFSMRAALKGSYTMSNTGVRLMYL